MTPTKFLFLLQTVIILIVKINGLNTHNSTTSSSLTTVLTPFNSNSSFVSVKSSRKPLSHRSRPSFYMSKYSSFSSTTPLDPKLNCIFIGCRCELNLIKCPSPDLDPAPMSMFPKRTFILHHTFNKTNLTIDLSANNLDFVPDDRFAQLDIHSLTLSANKLTKLSPDTFRDVLRLMKLDLSNNRLKLLNSVMFNPLASSLHTLNLSRNFLSEMEPARLTNLFAKLKKLKNLRLNQNRFFFMAPNFLKLETLEYLDLSSNMIEILNDPESNEYLLPSNLIELNLEQNRIKQLSDSWFTHMQKLKYLNLENNEISQLSEASFTSVKNLRTLNLNRNNLKHIPSKLFYMLNNLEFLGLSGQKERLERVEQFAFDRESNQNMIHRIDLSNNQIGEVDSRAFCVRNNKYRPFVNVKEFDLSFNSDLNRLDACVLRQLGKGFRPPKKKGQLVESRREQQQKPLLKLVQKVSNEESSSGIECSCELSRARMYIDLNGTCLESGNGRLSNLKNYECRNDFSSMKSVQQIDAYCASNEKYDCLDPFLYDYYEYDEEELEQKEIDEDESLLESTTHTNDFYSTLPVNMFLKNNDSSSSSLFINDLILINKLNHSISNNYTMKNSSDSSDFFLIFNIKILLFNQFTFFYYLLAY
jgi:Leucine-rich repeat (LRR) protein